MTQPAREQMEAFYANPTGEYEHALRLAGHVLDDPNQDPDSDLSMLARQFLRRVENVQTLLSLTPPAQGGECRWVPVEPTEEMIASAGLYLAGLFDDGAYHRTAALIWCAMVNADLPTLPSGDPDHTDCDGPAGGGKFSHPALSTSPDALRPSGPASVAGSGESYGNQVEEIAVMLAWKCEEAALNPNDLVTLNRAKLRDVALEVVRLARDNLSAPASDGLRSALQKLETACDNLCATRSQETYLRMIDVDNAMEALEALDEARREARAALDQPDGMKVARSFATQANPDSWLSQPITETDQPQSGEGGE